MTSPLTGMVGVKVGRRGRLLARNMFARRRRISELLHPASVSQAAPQRVVGPDDHEHLFVLREW